MKHSAPNKPNTHPHLNSHTETGQSVNFIYKLTAWFAYEPRECRQHEA